MKLHVVPARTGAFWVRDGVRTFARQPLAMGGLFFMLMIALSLPTIIPQMTRRSISGMSVRSA